MQHHTEFPRKYVIPLADGVKAVRQFLDSGDFPTCINWEEVGFLAGKCRKLTRILN